MALDTIRYAHAGMIMIMIMIMARDLDIGVLLQLLLTNGDKIFMQLELGKKV